MSIIRKPEDMKRNTSIMFSPKEHEEIDKAREIVGKRFGEFVRSAAIKCAKRINNKVKKESQK